MYDAIPAVDVARLEYQAGLERRDARAEFPKERPTSPQDVLATMYHQLGINRHKSYVNDANRPVEILNYGDPIDELIA